MRLELVFPGKTREAYLKTGIAEFTKRLSHYVRTEIRIVRDGSALKDGSRAVQYEGEQLLAGCSRPSYLVALDPAGHQFSSEELARALADWAMQGRQVVSFVIGGATGIAPAVLARADLLLSLSRMTFTHEMARLILLEQLYRAYTINAGTKYHKGA